MERRGSVIVAGVVLALAFGLYLLFHKPAPPPPASRRLAAAVEASPPPPARPTGAAAAEARRARDALREQILEAMRRRAAASPPAPAAPKPAGAPDAGDGDEPRGHYDPEYIRAVFREDMFPLLRQCYGAALERQPKLAGKLVLTFAIVGDPSVGGVVEDGAFSDESTLKDPEMETCVRESLMSLTFDKPPSGGGRVTVSYPVAFAPEDDGEGDGGGK